MDDELHNWKARERTFCGHTNERIDVGDDCWRHVSGAIFLSKREAEAAGWA